MTPKNLPAVTEAVLADATKPPPAVVIENLLAYAVAKADATGLAKLVAAVGPKQGPFTGDQFKLLGSLLDALDRRKSSLTELAKSGESGVESGGVTGFSRRSRRPAMTAADPKAPASDRLTAVRSSAAGRATRPTTGRFSPISSARSPGRPPGRGRRRPGPVGATPTSRRRAQARGRGTARRSGRPC